MPRIIGFCISICLSLAVLSLSILLRQEIALLGSMAALDLLEAKALDLRFHARGRKQPDDNIVIIAVDEASENELGRWQSQGRHWLAKMLDILQKGEANTIGFDFTLAEADRGSASEAIEAIANRYQVTHQADKSIRPDMLAYLHTLNSSYNYDRQLADAIQRAGNVVLGIYHMFDRASSAHLPSEHHQTCRSMLERIAYTAIKFQPGVTPQPLSLPHSFGLEPNLPIFTEAAKSCGHFTIVPEADGYIRQAPLLVEYQGAYYPSLSLEIARAYLNPSLPPLIHALGREGGGSLHAIQLGDRYIPTDQQGRLLLNFYGPAESFTRYSLSDVIAGKIHPERFKDKIVLVGFTSTIAQDVHSTPFQPLTYPGVEVHATIIENILREDFLTRPGWTLIVEPALIVMLGIVLGVLLPRQTQFSGVYTAFISGMTVVILCSLAFIFGRVWMNMTFPLLFIALDYIALTSYKYVVEERKSRKIKHVFQHYVSPHVVDQLLKPGNELQLGGEQRCLSALFSDIRGFTGISEQIPPVELVQFLNEFFTAMTDIVIEHNGTVDKYMGDAIMAFYGAPLELSDHAGLACRTAVDMMLRLKQLQVEWEALNLPNLELGIGINSGEMVVGNMGSQQRYGYTIMGDHVNLASRLEGINKLYGSNIIISQFTYDLIQHDGFTVRELDLVRVKGKKTPIRIYELCGYGELYRHKQLVAEGFAEGLKMYRKQQWEQAAGIFRELLKKSPDDGPSKVFISRCETFRHTPPPEDWDGVFVMTTK